ncbi:MAG: START domain-containing protein [Saprospiraceae bacterium]|nr:START domain-containing protein [Saprospiraceae bacterium]
MSYFKSFARYWALPILLFTLFAGTGAAQTNADGWELKNEKNGVKVYYRKTPGVYELKLTTSIKVPLSGIVSLFDEVAKYPEWGYKVAEARLLKRVSPTEMYYYSRIDFPWPMSDRDVVLHTTLEQNPHNHTVTSTSVAVSGWAPEVKDVVRLKRATTRWTLIPGAGGWLYVEYFLSSDPGGSIPDWAINMALDMGPRETIKRMKMILKEPAYQNTKLAHIRE